MLITLLFLSFERREKKSISQPHIPHPKVLSSPHVKLLSGPHLKWLSSPHVTVLSSLQSVKMLKEGCQFSINKLEIRDRPDDIRGRPDNIRGRSDSIKGRPDNKR